MRVLYLNPFSQEVSGPDESLLTLLGALIPLGIEAHLVLPRPGPQVARYEALGVRVHFAPLSVLRRKLGVAGTALFGPRLVRGVGAVARIARREKIDLIHTNMEVVLDGALAARALRLPHVLHYRGNTLDEPKLVFDALTALWSTTALRILCISEATAALFRSRGIGNVEVFYNPVDLSLFSNAERSDEVRRQLGASPGDLLAATVGRIHPRKDLETFLRAGALVAGKDPRLRLAVVGSAEGPEEHAYGQRLRALAAQLRLGDRLVWAGASRDIPRVLRALDVFILSSRHEGFGRVVAEAMAASIPVVVTDEGGPRELVEANVQGLTATPGDAAAFARCLDALLNDPVVRARMGNAGLARAELFAVQRAAKRTFSLYAAAVAA